MDYVMKLVKKPEDENKVTRILLRVFLVVGILASVCVIAKVLYDKCRKQMIDFDDDDCFDDYCDSILDEADEQAEEANEECGDCASCGLCEESEEKPADEE